MKAMYFALSALAVVIAGCKQSADKSFSNVIQQWAQHRKISRSELDVQITPKKTTIAPTEGKSRGEDIMILALQIEVLNNSQVTIESTIAHEWYGGEWPPTDLNMCVPHWEHEKTPFIHPVYLVGETREMTEPTIIAPGQSLTFNLRMDWPGAGAGPAFFPMDKDVSRTYQLKMFLVFETDGKKQYAESPEMKIHVRRINEAGNGK